jgi:hypothetical protein
VLFLSEASHILDRKGAFDMETTAKRMTPKPLSTWLLLASLYMTQHFGLGFFWIALVAIMRRQCDPLERLGLIYTVTGH